MIFIILLAVNLFALLLMGIDKLRAIHSRWRISEKALLLACVPFSALGGLMGMKLFHHKTKKPKFSIGVPALLVIQCIAAAYLLHLFK